MAHRIDSTHTGARLRFLLRSSAAALALACAATLAPGCDGSEPERTPTYGGLLHREQVRAEPIDVARAATDGDELLRAARMPHRQVGAALGAHVFRATSSVETTAEGAPGNMSDRMEIQARIEYERDDRFHALVENSKDYGREVVCLDGSLYLRPRYSKYHRRAPVDASEPAQIRDDVFAELGAHVELLYTGIQPVDQGAVDVAGRKGRRIELRKAATPRKPRPETTTQRAWRESIVVEEVAGEIVLDQQTGVPLSATVRGQITATRDGKHLRMRVSVEHHIEQIGQAVAVAAPAEDQWVATPARTRELEERNALLEGIAQPARTAPTPANPSGATEAPAEAVEPAPPAAGQAAPAGQAAEDDTP